MLNGWLCARYKFSYYYIIILLQWNLVIKLWESSLSFKPLYIYNVSLEHGSHTHWKVMEFFCKIFRTWKVLENDFGPGKSCKFDLKVLESSGICCDTDAMMWMRRRKYVTSAHLWFSWFVLTVIKHFLHYMWQWWTLQYGCYCHTFICRASKCCLSLYLHVAGDYDRVFENTFGVLESPGKLLKFIWCKTMGTLLEIVNKFSVYVTDISLHYSVIYILQASW